MSPGSNLPPLRSLFGRRRQRSDAESVESIVAVTRAAKRAVRIEAETEAARIKAETEAARIKAETEAARIRAETETAALQLYQQLIKDVPFRFLGLLEELKEMVYSNYTTKIEPFCGENAALPLWTFAVPALGQANLQIRGDFLAVFFRRNTSDHVSRRENYSFSSAIQ